MIKVSVLYPNTAGNRFDMTYYLNQGVPMGPAEARGCAQGDVG